MAESTKRALSAEVEATPEAAAEQPSTPTSEPAPKRARTSLPSGIPGIADVPVDAAARSTFFDVTEGLVAAGAKPVEQMERNLEAENMDIIMGQDSVSDDDEDDEDGMVLEQLVSQSTSAPPSQEPAAVTTAEDEASEDVDGEAVVVNTASETAAPAPSASSSAPTPAVASTEPVDERVAFPTRYLTNFWRTITKLHTPRYELTASRTVNPQLYGCTLHLHFPPSSTRSFTVNTTFANKREAKDAASATALKAGVCEKGVEAREKAGPEQEALGSRSKVKAAEALAEEGGDPWGTVDNPAGILHQAVQRFMPVGKFWFEWELEQATSLHGVTLHIPVTDSLTKTYTLPPTYTSRKEGKDAIARIALRDGIVALYEEKFKERLEKDSGGYLSFSQSGADASGKEQGIEGRDAIAVLNKECTECFGNVKALGWKFSSVNEEPDPTKQEKEDVGITPSATSVAPVQLHGVTLTITLHPPSAADLPSSAPSSQTGLLSFPVPPTFLSRQHARMAAAAAALKGGAVAEMKRAKKEWGAKAGVGGLPKEKKPETPLPTAGSVKYEDLKNLGNGTAYLNLCFQRWTGTTAPISFEYTLDAETGKHGCRLTIMPSTLLGVRKYSTANDHTSKKAAKEAVVQLAFADRVLDLIQPKSFAKGGGAALRGGKTGSRGAINGKGAMRGGMNGGGRGGFGGQAQGRFGGPPGGFNNGYATPPYPSQSPHPSPYFNQQQPLPNGQPQHNVHLFGPFAPPPGTPPAQGQDMVAYLDDFCRDWMGPSAPLPSYDVRQNPRTGLFGAVVRLSLAPNDANTKAFWVDFDFHTRADAQEAVARISVMDGVLDVVRREVPRFVGGVVAGAGFGPGPVARQPPPHQQPQTRFQQPQPQPRATGRQPLPPQGSPSVGPQAGGFAQQHRGAGKQDKPRAGTNKASNGPAAKPKAQAQASRDEADGKKSSLMASLYQTYEVLFDGQLSRKPVFDVSPADGSGRFAGSVRIALSPSQVISYTTPSIYTNKRDAKEAAAALAINEGKAVEQMKAVAAGEWAGAGTKASESTSTAEKASASSSSGRAGPAQVGQQGGGGANLASAQSFGLAGAGVAPSHQSAASSVGGAALPSGQGSSALVGVASTASSQPPRASSFGSAQQAQKKEGDSKAMSTLKDFCTSNSYTPPEFSSEAGLTTTSPDGSTSTTGVRVWCIVGELKFELPRPKSVEEGTEKLAGRVLKHLTAEVEKRKTEGTV